MFSIYIPGRRGDAAKLLRSVGAGWALDKSVEPIVASHMPGPDGGRGALVTFDCVNTAKSYGPQAFEHASQEWAPTFDEPSGKYWIGLWKDHQPGPADLQRKQTIDGLPLELLDGGQWQIPYKEKLPRRYKVDRATGRSTLVPLEKFADFGEQTDALFGRLVALPEVPAIDAVQAIALDGGLHYAAAALSLNYRVNVDLVEMLGLVGPLEVMEVILRTTGLALFAHPRMNSPEAAARLKGAIHGT